MVKVGFIPSKCIFTDYPTDTIDNDKTMMNYHLTLLLSLASRYKNQNHKTYYIQFGLFYCVNCQFKHYRNWKNILSNASKYLCIFIAIFLLHRCLSTS